MYFRYYLITPLGKGGIIHLNKLESPSPKDALCQVKLKLAQWFWRRRFFNLRFEKKMKMWKVYRRTNRQTDGQTDRQTTDDRWSEKLTWAFSSGELKTIGLMEILKILKFWKLKPIHTQNNSKWYFYPSFMNSSTSLATW